MDTYREHFLRLSGQELLTEIVIVMRHLRQFPADEEAMQRYEVAYEETHRQEGWSALWQLASLEV